SRGSCSFPSQVKRWLTEYQPIDRPRQRDYAGRTSEAEKPSNDACAAEWPWDGWKIPRRAGATACLARVEGPARMELCTCGSHLAWALFSRRVSCSWAHSAAQGQPRPHRPPRAALLLGCPLLTQRRLISRSRP